jgi:hypothetical protein
MVLVGLAGVALGRQRARRALARAGAGVVAIGLALPAVLLRTAPPPVAEVADGVVIHRGGATVVVIGSARVRADDLLEGLRRAGIVRIDVLVLHGGGPATTRLVAAVRHRWRPALVLAPTGNDVPGATTPPPGARYAIGRLVVTVLAAPASARHLVVRVDHATGQEALRSQASATGFDQPSRGPPACGQASVGSAMQAQPVGSGEDVLGRRPIAPPVEATTRPTGWPGVHPCRSPEETMMRATMTSGPVADAAVEGHVEGRD